MSDKRQVGIEVEEEVWSRFREKAARYGVSAGLVANLLFRLWLSDEIKLELKLYEDEDTPRQV